MPRTLTTARTAKPSACSKSTERASAAIGARWLRFAAKTRQQTETIDQRKNDHHREQQDLQTQQSTVGRADECLKTADQQEGVDCAGGGEQRNCSVSDM